MLKALTLCLSFLSVYAFAGVELENGDNSQEANMCIDAVLDESFEFNAKNEKIACNGMAIKDFAKKYRPRMLEATETKVVVFQLEATNEDKETQLCIAAAGGRQKLISLARALNYDDYNKVKCNGKGINEFVKDLRK